MSNESDRISPPPQPAAANSRRRSSFVELFSRSPPMNSTGNSQFAGPITQVAAHAQQRRLSLSTVGLGTASGQPSPFNNLRSRGDSMSSGTSASVDESPFEDGDAAPSSATASPFARRLSFGARALRDVRASNGNGNLNGRHSVAKASPPTAKGRGLSSLCAPLTHRQSLCVDRMLITHYLCRLRQ